jgi:hypothetical protein
MVGRFAGLTVRELRKGRIPVWLLLGAGIAQTLFGEIGPDFTKYRSASAFASWMGPCPDNEISGATGLAIVDAILAGERDAKTLAALRDPRIKVGAEVMEKSLCGNWRDEHLFTLELVSQIISRA